MTTSDSSLNRRGFLKKTALFTAGFSSMASLPLLAADGSFPNQDTNINVFAPREGYDTQIGFLVSMMDWMRMVMMSSLRGLQTADLDFLLDDKANSIGAMLMHMAATERFYQINTFDGKRWGNWKKKDLDEWSVASGLGEQARKEIKGNELPYYEEKLADVRANTLKEFANRDDNWLLAVDDDFPWGPTNNLCKWFHVCEHESNHNGQIKLVRSRITT
ncbi:MAG: DUF664 domain-containing protein [Bacteroidota bacterium]